MRIALVIAVSALVAGCSGAPGGSEDRSTQTSIAPIPTSSLPTASPSVTSRPPAPTPTAAPAPGAALADVIRWIEAGTPVDPGGYGSMTRDGVSTPLTAGVAFTTARTETNCVTDQYQDGALACLVKLSDPPPRPSGIETAWKDNWVDFAGTTVDVGSPHGDPGPFINGTGAELPAGRSLAFGDYRCRADTAGLFCVDYAHQTAVRMSPGGIEPFGCLAKVTPPADIGLRFSC